MLDDKRIQSAKRFQIGDTVRVDSRSPYYEDWRNLELRVSGMQIDERGHALVHVTEHWPPLRCNYTEWEPDDLVLVASPDWIMDERGTTWTRPTTWAYKAACTTANRVSEDYNALKRRVLDFVGFLETGETVVTCSLLAKLIRQEVLQEVLNPGDSKETKDESVPKRPTAG